MSPFESKWPCLPDLSFPHGLLSLKHQLNLCQGGFRPHQSNGRGGQVGLCGLVELLWGELPDPLQILLVKLHAQAQNLVPARQLSHLGIGLFAEGILAQKFALRHFHLRRIEGIGLQTVDFCL